MNLLLINLLILRAAPLTIIFLFKIFPYKISRATYKSRKPMILCLIALP